MTLKETFEKERTSIKDMPFRKKIEYIFYYHKLLIAVTVLIVVFVFTGIYPILNRPETLMNAVLLNTYNDSTVDPSKELISGFLKENEINAKKKTVEVDYTMLYSTENPALAYQSMQVLFAKSAVNNLNIIISDADVLNDLAYKDFFTDLRQILSEQQIKKYDGYIIYFDKNISDCIAEKTEAHEDVSNIAKPFGKNPENMVNPVPIVLDVSSNTELKSIYENRQNELYLGVVTDEGRKTVSQFVDYLFK